MWFKIKIQNLEETDDVKEQEEEEAQQHCNIRETRHKDSRLKDVRRNTANS